MDRKKRTKKKWVILTTVMVFTGILSLETAAPSSSPAKPITNSKSSICRQGTLDKARFGSCDAGGNCCSGAEVTGCDSGGSGFPRV
jgi:hypothetical protein